MSSRKLETNMAAKVGNGSFDWFTEISRISKRVYMHDPGSDADAIFEMTDGLKSPKDWIEFVMNDFKWEPFDPRKEKTPGYPLPLPPALDDITAYNLTEIWHGIEGLYLPERGRYVVATRDLMPGELVLREKAFGSIVNHNRLKDTCATCKKHCYPDDEASFILCETCRACVWCSQACKELSDLGHKSQQLPEDSVRNYHVWECDYMKRLQANFRHYTMALRMVLSHWNQLLKRFIWGERKVGNDLYPNEPDEYELITNFENMSQKQCLEFAMISKTLMYILKAGGFFARLREEALEMKNDLLIQLGKTTKQEELSYLLKRIVTYQLLFSEEKLNEKLEIFVATTIMEHIMRIKSNCFELNSSLVWMRNHPHEPSTYQQNGVTPVGTVLFLKTSQINHSCKPNCDFFFTGDTQNVKTIDRIKKGEELFITYERVGKSMPDREDRIPHLMRSFGFECFCNFCQGSELDDLTYQSDNDNDVNPRIIKEIDDLLETADSDIELMNLTRAERSLFAAKDLANKYRQYRRVFEIDDILNLCFGLSGNLILSTY